VARTRTTKKIAQRIDLNYFRRPTPLKRAKLWLSVLAPLLALIWVGEHAVLKDVRVYSSGRLSEPHAMLEKQCGLCHVKTTGEFSAKANLFACLNCHDGPTHHSLDLSQNDCVSCHSEHRGRINISSPSNAACAACHSNLRAHRGRPGYANQIQSFENGHPEFAALRPAGGIAARDKGTIKLNHAIHMRPIRTGATGSEVQLSCGNCHAPNAAPPPVTYSDAKYVNANISYLEKRESASSGAGTATPRHPPSGWELMAPVKFANACSGCHLLTFDKRFDYGVPHDTPEIVRAFLVRAFREYIAAHPGELRVQRDAGPGLTGRPFPPAVRVVTPAQWVNERTAEAEDLLWRKTCKQCHALMRGEDFVRRRIKQSSTQEDDAGKIPPGATELPEIALANTTLKWMPHSKFDHGAHEGFTCVSCHAKALTSTESSDVLLPGIETCKKCHAPGLEHAESRCFECHTYHDWSKRKEIMPKFNPPELTTVGR
jgi:hypothetical protein